MFKNFAVEIQTSDTEDLKNEVLLKKVKAAGGADYGTLYICLLKDFVDRQADYVELSVDLGTLCEVVTVK